MGFLAGGGMRKAGHGQCTPMRKKPRTVRSTLEAFATLYHNMGIDVRKANSSILPAGRSISSATKSRFGNSFKKAVRNKA
jgi:hypothetical protein